MGRGNRVPRPSDAPAARPPPRRSGCPRATAPFLVAGAAARDTGDSAGDGTAGHFPSSARSGRHAKNATAWPPPYTPGCNTAIAATEAERMLRTASTNSAAATAPDKSLASDKIVDHHQEDPGTSTADSQLARSIA